MTRSRLSAWLAAALAVAVAVWPPPWATPILIAALLVSLTGLRRDDLDWSPTRAALHQLRTKENDPWTT